MGLFHFLKKKHSSDQARDRLKLLLVSGPGGTVRRKYWR